MENPIVRFYNHINYHLPDPRTEHLPLVTSPITVIMITAVYNLVCLKIGPKLMERREPFKIRNLVISFDLFQIIANTYIFYKILVLGWISHYRFACAEVELEDNPRTREIAFICYFYFVVKLTDMMDTIFMVLKKKNKNITFLHMYHHSIMILTSFINVKYIPSGHQTCLGIYNTFVHAIMYSYYLWAALNPQSNLLQFKKIVTKLQLAQFGIIGMHGLLTLIVPNCNYPSWPLFLLFPNTVLMVLLFSDFYRRTYILKKNKSVNAKANSPVKID